MNLNDLYENRQSFHLPFGGKAKVLLGIGILIGLTTAGFGLSQGMGTQVWGAFLLNLFFFFTLALGGMVFAAMQDIIGATWARPIKRLHEAFGAFIPIAIGLFFLFFIAIKINIGGAGVLYKWIADPTIVEHFAGKRDWLLPDFMIIRDAIALLIIGWLTCWQLRGSLKRDGLFVNGDREQAEKVGKLTKQNLRFWSGPVLVIYSLCFTLLGFDLLMSLSPLWFSTLWGGWLFAIMMQTLMATMLLIMFTLHSGPIGSVIRREHFHDIGKLLHGFSIFFAYLTYAHVLTYWYGNVPEETEYFIHRMHGPWIYFLWIIPLVAFVLPLYLLLFKAAKWTRSITIPLCLVIMAAQWGTSILVVTPEIVGQSWPMPFVIEGGMLIFFLSLFLGSYLWFGKKYPMVCLGDPLLKTALKADHH